MIKDSPAEQAGLKQGDEIVAVEGMEFRMHAQAQFQLLTIWLDKGVHASEPVRIKVRRKAADGKTTTEDVRVVAR